MLLDAIVLAGGRSSRLAGTPKAGLVYRGETLLKRTVAACSSARRVVVVGDVAALDLAERLSDRVLVTREDPPFSGPASGIGAGVVLLTALEAGGSDYTLVLACDMPDVGRVVIALLDALRPGVDGVLATDAQQHPQFLAAIYNSVKLAEAVNDRAGAIDGLSVRALVSGLDLVQVHVADGSTDDIDTWADAARYEIAQPPVEPESVAIPATSPASLPTDATGTTDATDA